jgi:hypothetical protein
MRPGRGPRRLSWAALAAVVLAAGTAPARAESAPVELVKEPGKPLYALRATDATLEQLGRELGRFADVRLEADEKLRTQRVTLDVSPRPLERLLPVLARRFGARIELRYDLARSRPGAAERPRTRLFASRPVTIGIVRGMPLSDVLQGLRIPSRVEGGLDGKITLPAAKLPLSDVLDRVASQLGASWQPVVRFQRWSAPDEEAEETERRHAFFADLAGLSPEERREELRSDVEQLGRLPEPQRGAAVQRMASDLLSLSTLYASVPGEHRGPIAGKINGILADYRHVLGGIGPEQRAGYGPLFTAFDQVRADLNEVR